jgi:trigger factor
MSKDNKSQKDENKNETKQSATKDANNYKIINKSEEKKLLSLEIELPFSELESKREAAIKNLGEHVEIKGFRKGTAPAKMVEDQVGKMKVLEEMAYQAVVENLPNIVIAENINALTQPKISITKIADNNPLTFKAEFILMPDIEVADYKKIAKETEAAEESKVTDQEIDEYIDYIRNSKAEADAMKKKTSPDPEERKEANDKKEEAPELPELNDEFVKTLGDFKNVDDFKKQLRENMEKDKAEKAKQKRRISIIEKIIEESKIDIPDIMVEEELQRMMDQFKGDLQMAKMDFDEYIKSVSKTPEDLLKEWRPDAIKRTKMNLILPKIAASEKIEADPEKVEHEVKHLKQHYPDISDAQAQSYVSHMLRNDEVFKFLEEIK